MLSLYELSVSIALVRLMEKVRGENEADAQKETEIEAEQILAELSPGPIPCKYTAACPGNQGKCICSSA